VLRRRRANTAAAISWISRSVPFCKVPKPRHHGSCPVLISDALRRIEELIDLIGSNNGDRRRRGLIRDCPRFRLVWRVSMSIISLDGFVKQMPTYGAPGGISGEPVPF
jgi:hypothetical protein